MPLVPAHPVQFARIFSFSSGSSHHLVRTTSAAVHLMYKRLVCLYQRWHLITRQVRGKRIRIKACNLPPWNLVITCAQRPSVLAHNAQKHTHWFCLFCERMKYHVTSARTTEFSVNWEYSCDLSHLCLCLSPLKNGWISGLWALNWPVLDQKLPPFRTFSKNSSNLGWTGVPNTWCVFAPIGLLEYNNLFLSNDLRRSAVAKDFGEGCSVPIPNLFLCIGYFLATTPSWQESKDKISHKICI